MEVKEISIPTAFQSDIEKAIRLLNEEGCSEIYLFGSLVTGDFRAKSDIDLGVKGCPAEGFFQIFSKLNDFCEHRIDLVDFEAEEDFHNMLKDIEEVIRIA